MTLYDEILEHMKNLNLMDTHQHLPSSVDKWLDMSWREPIISGDYLEKIQKGGRPEIFIKGTAGQAFNDFFDGEKPVHNTYQWDFVMADGDFTKDGFAGQGIYISPSRDVVVAFFAAGTDETNAVNVALAQCHSL